MADNGTAAPAHLNVHDGSNNGSYFTESSPGGALRDALTGTKRGGAIRTPSYSASEEDYDDDESRKPVAVVLGEKTKPGKTLSKLNISSGLATPSDASSDGESLGPLKTKDLSGTRVYTVASDDKELRDILRRGLQRVSIGSFSTTDTMSEHQALTIYRRKRRKTHKPNPKDPANSVILSSPGSSRPSIVKMNLRRTVPSTASSPCSG